MLKSLHAFRGIFALIIFSTHYNDYCHCSFGASKVIDGGAGSVVFFFILSGLAISAGYQNRLLNGSAGISGYDFILKRIKRIYPLHFFCFLLCLIAFRTFSMENVGTYMCNLFLLQSWIPDMNVYFSCNGVSWYLSTLLFSYIMYPYIVRLIPWIKRKRVVSVGLFVALISVYAVIVWLVPQEYAHGIVYAFPVVRMIDFIIGILCWNALVYVQSNKSVIIEKIGLRTVTSLQLMALFMIWAFLEVFLRYRYVFPMFTLVAYWWAPCVLLIMVFSIFDDKPTIINRILRGRVLQRFADMSFSFFMIHQMFISIWMGHFEGTWLCGSHGYTFFVVLTVCTALAWPIYKFVELGQMRIKSIKFKVYRGG